MIVKEKAGEVPEDVFGKAGYKAEQQMAFYLRRAFGESDDIHVFNDLRLERSGEFAQIDHLVLHRFGFVLIESKSVSGTIEVNGQLEFVRIAGGQRRGMQSPIQQVKLQCELLRQLLEANKEKLRKRVLFGLRQAGFSEERFHRLVAISDGGEIKRLGGNPPELIKADSVTENIRDLIDRHNRTLGLAGTLRMAVADKQEARQLDKDYRLPFNSDELKNISEFLSANHQELARSRVKSSLPATRLSLPSDVPPAIQSRPSAVPPPHTTAQSIDSKNVCRHCKSQNVEIVFGKFGYYFKCSDCDGNTNIDSVCPKCAAKAKISKKALEFKIVCSACGGETHFHNNSRLASRSDS